MDSLAVLGAGGHAAVVTATAHAGGFEMQAVLDDDPSKLGQSVLGVPVRGVQEFRNLGDETFTEFFGDEMTDSFVDADFAVIEYAR